MLFLNNIPVIIQRVFLSGIFSLHQFVSTVELVIGLINHDRFKKNCCSFSSLSLRDTSFTCFTRAGWWGGGGWGGGDVNRL